VIESVLAALASGIESYATVLAMTADTGQVTGKLAKVYANNGSASDPANTYYQWNGSAWVVATWYVTLLEGPPGADGLGTATTAAEVWAGLTAAKAVTPAALDESGLFEAAMQTFMAGFGGAMLRDLQKLKDDRGIAGEAPASLPSSVIEPLRGPDNQPAAFDYVPGQLHWVAGRLLRDEAAMLAAHDGVVVAGVTRIGPYREPFALTNQNLANGTLGWTALGTGSALAIVDDTANGGDVNTLQLTAPGGGVTAGAYYTLTDVASRAFEFGADIRRGSTASSVQIAAGFSSSMAAAISSANAITSYQTKSVIVGATTGNALTDSSTLYLGMRSSTGAGTSLLKDPALYELTPFAGFVQGAFMLRAKGKTPVAAGSGIETLWQVGLADGLNFIKVQYDHSTDTLAWVVEANGILWTSTGKVVAPETAFQTVIGLASDNADVSFDGANVIHDANISIPAAAYMWLLGSDLGEAWTGDETEVRLTYYPLLGSTDFIEHAAAADDALVTGGDSFVAGAGGVVMADDIAADLGRETIDIAEGGTDLDQQVAVALARPYLAARTQIFLNGTTSFTAAEDAALWERFLAFIGHPAWIRATPIQAPPTSGAADPANADYLRYNSIRDALLAAHGTDHIVDTQAVLMTLPNNGPDDAADKAAGFAPRSYKIDNIHWNQTAMDAVNAAIRAKVPVVEAL
jgi:hypothetical protein